MIRLRQLGIMMVSLALAGCGGAATPASNPPASAASAPPAASAAAKPSAPASAAAASGAASAAAKPAASGAAAGKPSGEAYKLGVTYPLTGPLAAFGADILPGITIAVDDINKAGGIMGHPLQLVSEDTKSTPEAGVAAMRKVVDLDKVPVVLTAFTNVVTAQMALADQVKVPIIAPAESPGLVAKSDWAFAHAPTFALTSPLLQAQWKAVGVKSIFALYPNNPIADYFSPITKKIAQELGASYDETKFALGSTDFRGLLAKAKDAKPDAILPQGQCTADDGAIIKQARELGINATIYQGGGCFTTKSWRDSTGTAAEGLVYAAYKFDPSKAPGFTSAYQAKMSYEPSYTAVEAYDMVLMIKSAIEQNGFTGDGIRKGLAATKELPSIGGGTITMGADHQTSPSVAL
ncbi:MAG TPA: ABC transporter substrate-binding protein, partial [Chloroflexota bacterium]|nr:ABC transporter substrate-binding protein [Chloroflexota bacterium]